MKFLDSSWLPLCAIPFLLLLAACIRRAKQQENWRSFVSSDKLAKRLVQGGSPLPWWISTTLIAIGSALLFFTVATPTNGTEEIELPSRGRNIYIAVDLSRSMLVRDVSPDRLTMAKTAAIELIDAFPAEQIGLITFAGKAWLEAPLTTDHAALRETVLAMNENTITYGGSAPTPLFSLITDLMPKEEKSEALLILLSDGEFHSDPNTEEIQKAVDTGVQVFTLGFGTPTGDYIPDTRSADGLFRDRSGRTILSTLQTSPLEKIALLGRGAYFTGHDYSFTQLLTRQLDQMEGQTTATRSLTSYKHIYPYFLIPAVTLLFLAALTPTIWQLLTRTALSLFLCTVLLEPTTHAATQPSPAPAPLDEETLNRLAEESTDLSVKINEAKGENVNRYSFAKGVKDYQRGEFEDATHAFSQSLLSEKKALQTEAHYNLGNTLYRSGTTYLKELPKIKKATEQLKFRQAIITQWYDALDHYTGSLHLTPDHPTARDNYDYVKKELNKLELEQKQQMQQMQQQGEGEPQEGEGNGKGNGAPGSGNSEEEGDTWEELQEKIKEAEEGQNGQENENKNGPDGSDEQKEAGQEPDGEEGEQAPPHQGTQPEEQPGLRPGESAQDHAERLLREGSDSESGTLKSGRRKFRSPEKNW